MEIRKNKITGGIFCVFQKDDNFFYADLSFTIDHGYECMIFPCDKNGKVKSWQEVFVKLYDGVSEENLVDSVTTFLSQ